MFVTGGHRKLPARPGGSRRRSLAAWRRRPNRHTHSAGATALHFSLLRRQIAQLPALRARFLVLRTRLLFFLVHRALLLLLPVLDLDMLRRRWRRCSTKTALDVGFPRREVTELRPLRLTF